MDKLTCTFCSKVFTSVEGLKADKALEMHLNKEHPDKDKKLVTPYIGTVSRWHVLYVEPGRAHDVAYTLKKRRELDGELADKLLGIKVPTIEGTEEGLPYVFVHFIPTRSMIYKLQNEVRAEGAKYFASDAPLEKEEFKDFEIGLKKKKMVLETIL